MDFLKTHISLGLKIIIILLLVTLIIITTNNGQKDKVPIEEVEEKLDKEKEINNNIHIDIKGAVKNPGVYILPAKSLVNDAINISGGLLNNASTKYTNLSKTLENETIIYIYTEEEIKSLEKGKQKEYICSNQIITQQKKSENSEKDTKISINNATKEELTTLSGIGEAKANAIIKYRDENGTFNDIEEIKSVPGISETLYEKIKDNIKL